MTLMELIRAAESLPVEERALLADSLLRSLNPNESGFEREWAEVAARRLEEVCTGKVQPIPAEEVFRKIAQRYSA